MPRTEKRYCPHTIMRLDHLCDDVLIIIYGFVDDKSGANLSLTSSRFSNFARNYGYRKNIIIHGDCDMNKLVELLSMHSRTLLSMKVINMANPSLWIPFFPEKVEFEGCYNLI